jgi:hypothetical protein
LCHAPEVFILGKPMAAKVIWQNWARYGFMEQFMRQNVDFTGLDFSSIAELRKSSA